MRQKTFQEKVLSIVRNIPKGKTLSYKEVAKKAGNEKASRVVGMLMKRNRDTSAPCHRVIRSDGKPGGYNGLLGKTKEALIAREEKEVGIQKKT